MTQEASVYFSIRVSTRHLLRSIKILQLCHRITLKFISRVPITNMKALGNMLMSTVCSNDICTVVLPLLYEQVNLISLRKHPAFHPCGSSITFHKVLDHRRIHIMQLKRTTKGQINVNAIKYKIKTVLRFCYR